MLSGLLSRKNQSCKEANNRVLGLGRARGEPEGTGHKISRVPHIMARKSLVVCVP